MEPPRWSAEALTRLSFWGFFLGAICLTGVARAWTERRAAARSVAPSSREERIRAQIQGMREQMDQANDELAQLPPETRKLIEDALPRNHSETMQNPIMTKLLVMSREKKAESAPAAALRRARAVIRAVQGLGMLAVWGLWLLVGFAVGKAAAGQVAGKPEWTEEAAVLAIDMAKRWMVLLSLLLAATFAATLENPWGRVPLAFYAAPLALLAAGAAARSRARDDSAGAAAFGDALFVPALGYVLTLAAVRAVAFIG